MWKDLTLEDCRRFKQEHPDLKRGDLAEHYVSYNMAMKALGCLDELYPKRRCRSHYDLTREDCERLRRENPTMNRKQLYKHHIIYVNAMKRLGCLDELWPAERPLAQLLTRKDCEQFCREHPDVRRKELRVHYSSYWNAMRRLKCLDELMPSRRPLCYDDAYLIERARKYKHVRDLNEHEPQVLKAIYYHGIEKEALKHMVPLGNRKWKLIYVYEFPDHSAYVGLTYDRERRKKDHRRDMGSAVHRHVKKTGLQPVYKELTDLLPVEKAQEMEGFYEEQYRKEGWKILNVAKTGGIGGAPKVNGDKVLELYQQGIPPKEICRLMDIKDSSVYKALKQRGISGYGMSSVPVEVMDDDGNVIETFQSINEAAKHFGMSSANLIKDINHHWRVRGHYMRHNVYAYKIKFGKEPPDAVYWK